MVIIVTVVAHPWTNASLWGRLSIPAGGAGTIVGIIGSFRAKFAFFRI